MSNIRDLRIPCQFNIYEKTLHNLISSLLTTYGNVTNFEHLIVLDLPEVFEYINLRIDEEKDNSYKIECLERLCNHKGYLIRINKSKTTAAL